jgi:FkbM family methyltransferase
MARVPLREAVPVEHLGTSYGGWYVPVGLIRPDWTCYCVGAGHDISLELALLERFGVRVRSFDPFERFAELARERVGDDARYTFHVTAVAPDNGPLVMVGRQDAERGGVSAAGLHEGDAFVKPARSLPSLMSQFGDDRVEFLKLDVEGLEYELLPSLDLGAMGVVVLGVEFHHTASPRRARQLIEALRDAGYEPVACKDRSTFTFVRATA